MMFSLGSINRIGLALLLSVVLVSPVLASQPVQITSNPGEDFAPSISRDGSFMVYVSDTSGNLDLWMKYLAPGIQPPDRRLTFHSTEDKSPTISPDGKQVAFVSNRSDPRGDIYVLDLQKVGQSDPSPLVQGKGGEADPAWSADQKYIYFASGTNEVSIYKIDVTSGEKSLVLKKGGINLSSSSKGEYLAFATGDTKSDLKVLNLKTNSLIELSHGPEIDVLPGWSNNSIFFTRYSDDTNRDGQLGIDDNPNIWKLDFVEGRAVNLRQLTDSSSYDFYPQPGTSDTVIYASHQKGSVDIWQLPQSGRIAFAKDHAASLENLETACSEESYFCAMALDNFQMRQALQKSAIALPF